jgi:Protein of unknown function (DUF642)
MPTSSKQDLEKLERSLLVQLSVKKFYSGISELDEQQVQHLKKIDGTIGILQEKRDELWALEGNSGPAPDLVDEYEGKLDKNDSNHAQKTVRSKTSFLDLEDPTKPSTKNRKIFMISLILMLFFVGTIVGVVLSFKKGTRNTNLPASVDVVNSGASPSTSRLPDVAENTTVVDAPVPTIDPKIEDLRKTSKNGAVVDAPVPTIDPKIEADNPKNGDFVKFNDHISSDAFFPVRPLSQAFPPAIPEAGLPSTPPSPPTPTSPAQPFNENLLGNADFGKNACPRSRRTCFSSDYSTISPWRVAAIGSDYEISKRGYYSFAPGILAMDLNSSGSSAAYTIQQTISTFNSFRYRLSFSLNENPCGVKVKTGFVSASGNGQQTFTASRTTKTVTYYFVALGSKTDVSIGSTSSGTCGPVIFNVQVVRIP